MIKYLKNFNVYIKLYIEMVCFGLKTAGNFKN